MLKQALILFFISVSLSFCEVIKLGFGSCLFQGDSMQILGIVKKQKPRLFVFLGDNVYGNFSSKRWPLWRAYKRQKMNLEAVGWNVPSLRIWDDGDLGSNDGGSDFKHLQHSRSLFLEQWGIDESDPRYGQDSLYLEKRISANGLDIQILILDVRSQKSPWKNNPVNNQLKRYLPDRSEVKTMLGVEQWNWLENKVVEKVDLRVFVSSIQVLATGHNWECWNMFPQERSKLLKLIDSYTAKHTLIVSGDRHRAAFYGLKMPVSGKYFLEVTTSGLNRQAEERDEPGELRLSPLYCKENFALLEVHRKSFEISLRDIWGADIGGRYRLNQLP